MTVVTLLDEYKCVLVCVVYLYLYSVSFVLDEDSSVIVVVVSLFCHTDAEC